MNETDNEKKGGKEKTGKKNEQHNEADKGLGLVGDEKVGEPRGERAEKENGDDDEGEECRQMGLCEGAFKCTPPPASSSRWRSGAAPFSRARKK